MSTWKRERGDWTKYRQLPDTIEYDFHRADESQFHDYQVSMQSVAKETLEVLQHAQEKGHQYVIFRHGWSTSRPGKTTARSQVRKVMRSPEATPYIIRRECIQHPAVFVAAIRHETKPADPSPGL